MHLNLKTPYVIQEEVSSSDIEILSVTDNYQRKNVSAEIKFISPNLDRVSFVTVWDSENYPEGGWTNQELESRILEVIQSN